jgi:hypothetical protein
VKFQVRLKLTVHADSPEEVVSLVLGRLQPKAEDRAKVNFSSLTLKPAGALRSSGQWKADGLESR